MGKERKEHPSSSNMHDKALANKYSLPEDYIVVDSKWGNREKNIHLQVTGMTKH